MTMRSWIGWGTALVVAVTGVIIGAPPAYAAPTPTAIVPLEPVPGSSAKPGPAPRIDPDAKSDPVPASSIDTGSSFDIDLGSGESSPTPSPSTDPDPTPTVEATNQPLATPDPTASATPDPQITAPRIDPARLNSAPDEPAPLGSWIGVGDTGVEVAAGAPQGSGLDGVAPSVDTLTDLSVSFPAPSSAASIGNATLLIRVERSDDGDGAAPVSVRIPDTVIQALAGGDAASRTHWVVVPERATEASAASRSTSPDAFVADAGDGTTVLSSRADSGGVTFAALTSGTSTTGRGDYTATPISAGSDWDVSGQTGALSWTYPITVPPAAAGPVPDLQFSYGSQGVDGLTSATNNQSSPIGLGWDLAGGGYIERQYIACSMEDGTGTAHAGSGDLCWREDNATISFGGHSGPLIQDTTSKVWKFQNDDGSLVSHATGAANCGANGTPQVDCWIITTTDGTRYYFGRNLLPGSGTVVKTNSTWTVPVFGDDPGEPCYTGTTFANNSCLMPWRWNLDYIVDVHGNAMAYYYNAETNLYRRNNTTAITYTRGGSLNHIDYGFRDGTAYAANAASSKVLFTYETKGRCIDYAMTSSNPCTTEPVTGLATAPANAAKYPDTPYDLRCAASPCTGKVSPTFWTTAMLRSVTTQVRNPGYVNVDTWTLEHTFPSPGDGTQAMWLQSITHSGTSGTTTVTEPPTTFDPISLQNRVNYNNDGLSHLDTMRMQAVHLSTGGTITVTYSAQDCDESDRSYILSHAESNTTRCFPQWWSPDSPPQAAQQDLFHKYVVTDYVSDPVTGGASDAPQEFHYLYGTPKWRYNTNRFQYQSRRTWSDFAGFDKVEIREGSNAHPESQRDSISYFFQGMDEDRANDAGDKRDVKISPEGTPEIEDSLWFAGTTRLVQTFDSALPTHTMTSSTLTTPYAGDVTASGIGKKSRFVGDKESVVTEPIAAGGSRIVTTTFTYGSPAPFWKPLRTEEKHSDGNDSCTQNTYTAPATALNIVGLVASTSTVALPCGSVGSAVPADAVTMTRFSYDGGAVGAAPTRGLLTKTEVVDDYPGGTIASAHWVTSNSATYDILGRKLTSTDILGRTTQTAYTPASTGPLTKTVQKNVLLWETTTNIEPTHGNPTSVVDANLHTTTMTYDALGRRTGVWYPERPQASNPQPSVGFAYTLSNTSTNAIATSTVGPLGIVTSYELFDGLARSVQKQAPADGTGAVISTNHFDGAGRIIGMDSGYWEQAVNPSTSLFVPLSPSEVPSWTSATFDGLDRTVAATVGSYGSAISVSSTSYDGSDSATTSPPGGGTPTTTITNSLGHVTSFTQYESATPSPSASKVTTTYQYDKRGNLIGMTDDAGNHWSWAFDVLGHEIQSVDPDAGTINRTFDLAGNLLTSVDGRGVTLVHTYDQLDRPKAVYTSAAVTGSLQTTWLYDTISKGQLTSSTSYVGSTPGTPGDAYTVAVTGYDAADRALGTTLTTPASTPGFGSQTITATTQYNAAGLVSKSILPAVAGLPAETINFGYDQLGYPASLSTAGMLVQASHNALGQLSLVDRTGTHRVTTAFGYDAATGAYSVIEHRYRTGTTVNNVIAATAFDRDDSGNVTSLTTTADGLAADTQCFEHDHLGAMTEAWTPSSGDCSAAPTVGALGGPAPYWQSYDVDASTGNRDAITRHGVGGDPTVTDTYDYPAPGASHPHAVSTVTHDDGSPSATDSYQYDPTGATTVRADQELTYDAYGRISTITDAGDEVQTRIYDASGALLVQTDPEVGAQLFVGDMILTKAPGAAAASGSRSYALAGISVAERNSVAGVSGTSVTWICSNDQSTPLVEVAQATGAVTRRYLDPFGDGRGATVAWSSVRSFLGLPASDFASLSQLGARAYDPHLGRFVTVDMVLSPMEPQQNSAYAYAQNHPATSADPSGNRLDEQGSSPNTNQGKSGGHKTGITPPPPPGTMAARPHNTNVGDWAMWSLAIEGQFLGGLAESAGELLKLVLWDATGLKAGYDAVVFLTDPVGHFNEAIEDCNQRQAAFQAWITGPDPGGAFWASSVQPMLDDIVNNPAHAAGYVTGTAATFVIPGGGALKAATAAEKAESITARLQAHVAEAVQKFDNGAIALSDKQAAGPKALQAAFKGQVIDAAVKAAVAKDAVLAERLYITKPGEFGPDFYDAATKKWWDVTTEKQWTAHTNKYVPTHGPDGTGLFY